MGRKKIKIQPIKEDRNRSVTYLKRKAGLFKKAHELAVLTDSQVAVIVFGHNGKLAEFCSTDIDLLLLRYTEYEGAAERKGPQHYLNLDKDSDDNDGDDGDNDDNDNASGDGPEDDFGGHSGANAGGAGGRRVSGVKRKSEPLSPRRGNPTLGSNGLLGAQDLGAFGVTGAPAGGIMAVGPSAKQTVNAAIRQKSQIRSGGNMAPSSQFQTQGMFDPVSFGQPFMNAAGGMQHNMVGGAIGGMVPGMPSSSAAAASSAGYFGAGSVPSQGGAGTSSVNPTRAQATANMSIPLPCNDRMPIFVSPAMPGFGMTPGGTVTTPGGRRSSFSDVLTRGSGGSMLQRPLTANSFLTPSFFNNDVFGMSATPPPHAAGGGISSISPSVTPQPPAQQQQQGAEAMNGQATLQLGAASTGVAPTHNEATYTAAAAAPNASLASSSTLASPAHIARPFTALANLDAPASSTHLVPPVTGFPGSIGAPDVNSTQAVPNTAFTASPYPATAGASADFKPSSTPLSSATPELIQKRTNLTTASLPGPGASASRSSISTDEETPPDNSNNAATLVPDSSSKHDPNTAWTGKPNSALVQPVPINPTQTLGSVPFDLNFPSTGA